MAVSKNKERITISLDKELLKYIRSKSQSNGRTVSEEIASMFENEMSDENLKSEY